MDRSSVPLAHLNLTVRDVDRSIEFYRRWFGFYRPPVTCSDGTVFVRNADAFDMALHPGETSGSPRAGWHFGFRPERAEQVRGLLSDLRSAGVPIVEEGDDPDYVGFKCLDPDGHVIEVYWEPSRG